MLYYWIKVQGWKMCPHLMYIALGAITTFIFIYHKKAFPYYGAVSGSVQWRLTPITFHYALWSWPRPTSLTRSDGSGEVIQVTAEKSQTLNRPNAPLSTIGEALSHTGYILTQSFALDGTCMNCWGCSKRMLFLSQRDRRWGLEGGRMAVLQSLYTGADLRRTGRGEGRVVSAIISPKPHSLLPSG